MKWQKKAENKIGLKLILLFIPVAYISYLFHESGHWIIGEVLGNDMSYSLNGVWPKSGHYIDFSHGLYVRIGGPAFTILQAMIFLLIIEKYKIIYAYPFVFFAFFTRFFALVFGGFNKQDEAAISIAMELGNYTFAIIVLLILFLIVWRAGYLLRINLKNNGYYFAISAVCQLLVIGTYEYI